MIANTLGKITLSEQQRKACERLKVGNILLGGVGSGKTYTSIFWASQYLDDIGEEGMVVVITTAMKRDLVEEGCTKPDWQESLENCGISEDRYTVDSWNNIDKYREVRDSIFIFDEQRVVGYGKWARSFIQIAMNGNKWILLTATPGDNWKDYIPVFIANGFYRNKTEFTYKHIEFDRYAKYPKIKRYHGTAILSKYRNQIIVPMSDNRHTERIKQYLLCNYPKTVLDDLKKTRISFLTGEPILNISEYTQLIRRAVGTDPSRVEQVRECLKDIDKAIVFYNYNYELELLRDMCESDGLLWKEWNGQKHEPIPNDEDKWVYLVQYNGAEGWNCITCQHMIFFSLNHSYKKMEQAEGRIDRSNTPFTKLYYYYCISQAKVDKDILTAVREKKEFNESAWAKQEVGQWL